MKKEKVRLINGEELAYIKHGTGKKNLIALHGRYYTSLYFETLIKELENEFTIYAVDLRGFGDSSYYREVKNTGNFAKDLMMFIEELEIEKPILLGWELGGAVALDFTARYTKVASKLILISSIPHKGLPLFKRDDNDKMMVGHIFENNEEMADDCIKFDEIFKAIKEEDKKVLNEKIGSLLINKNGLNKSWIKDTMKQKNYKEICWVLSNFNLSSTHNFYAPGIQTINRIRIPSLHMWGGKDSIIKEFMVKSNYLAMSEKKEFISYDDLGHIPFIDDPKAVAEDIIKFSNT